MLEVIGKELQITRIRKNLSREDVSNGIGVNRETLRRYETDASGLTIEKLENLLNFYKVDMTIFFENVCAYMQQLEKEKED